MTSSWDLYTVRVRKVGEPPLPKIDASNLHQWFPTGCACGDTYREETVRREYLWTIVGVNGVVYKELVRYRRCSATFDAEVLEVVASDGSRSGPPAVSRAALPAPLPLSKRVQEVENRCREAMSLLGEVMATFALPRNREKILDFEYGKELLGIIDSYRKRYDELKEESE